MIAFFNETLFIKKGYIERKKSPLFLYPFRGAFELKAEIKPVEPDQGNACAGSMKILQLLSIAFTCFLFPSAFPFSQKNIL
jgi:hypothetical protein